VGKKLTRFKPKVNVLEELVLEELVLEELVLEELEERMCLKSGWLPVGTAAECCAEMDRCESCEKTWLGHEPISPRFPVWISRSGVRLVLLGDRLESKPEKERRPSAVRSAVPLK
jgi:hypothetical protein